MLAVAKRSHLMPPVNIAHRRHPSAPSSLAVHPHPTPGLLTLSRPPRHTPPPANSRKHRIDYTTVHAPTVAPVPAAPTLVVVHEKDKQRGRSQHQSSERPRKSNKRSTSYASPKSSDTNPSSDPAAFSDSAPPRSPTAKRTNATAPPTPTVASPPINNKARNRRSRRKSIVSIVPPSTSANTVAAEPAPSTAPPLPPASAAIPFPTPPRRSRPTSNSPSNLLSRSDPVPILVPPMRRTVRRSTTDTQAHQLEQNRMSLPLSDWDLPAQEAPPLSPMDLDRTWQQVAFESGPHTTPAMSSTQEILRQSVFPAFSPPPSPTTTKRPRGMHRRTPSFPADTLFHMSLDEEDESGHIDQVPIVAHGLATSLAPMEADDVFGLPSKETSPSRSGTPPDAKKNPKLRAFASSSFQNSPSASDLPAPSFLVTGSPPLRF